jgi:hypothetical protein
LDPCAQDYLEGFSKVYALFSLLGSSGIAVIENLTTEDTEEHGAARRKNPAPQWYSVPAVVKIFR